MNNNLALLQPYPFEKLRELFAGVQGPSHLRRIELHIGEPKHPTPALITTALTKALSGLSQYPATAGTIELRRAIAGWLTRRYGLKRISPETQILTINGSREALFAIAQVALNIQQGTPKPYVISPNPFYQIYEGAALLGGAIPYYLNESERTAFAPDYDSVPESVWNRVQLLYTCSPANPSGRVMQLNDWKRLFELSDRYGFVIAADECYSELYLDESSPPLGALQAAQMLGREEYPRLLVFTSLSKRSNVPGMRSGFVAGDARLIKDFLLYRTYHGSAMCGTFQAASIAAWEDENHVQDNRRIYAEKFKAVAPYIREPLEAVLPQAGFYIWARTPIDDTLFSREFLSEFNVTTLPGSFLARESNGENPGVNRVRLALVAPLQDCVEAAQRLAEFSKRYL